VAISSPPEGEREGMRGWREGEERGRGGGGGGEWEEREEEGKQLGYNTTFNV
jgi:hypothetical protein